MTKLPNNKERHVVPAENTLVAGDMTFSIQDGRLSYLHTHTGACETLDALQTLRLMNLFFIHAKAIHEQAREQQRKEEKRKEYAGRNHKNGNFSSG